MKSRLLPLIVFVALIGFAACDAVDDESGPVTLVGQVLNDDTQNPISGAFVRIEQLGLLTETDELGRFTFDTEIDSSMQVTVTATRDGFSSDSEIVFAVPDRTITVPTLRLRQTAEEGPLSGQASNILLLSQSSQNIGVRESGSQEVAQITFQAADSLGRPVDLDHAVEVHFSFGESPNGGDAATDAFLHPSSVVTDNGGRATVNLSSGTRAGVVQIVARAEVDGRTIRSLPVSVAIHGGLPDQPHFSLGPERFNFPGLTKFGLTDPISVIVGDKYANPVKPGTAVYFTSTHGVIEGSVLTNAQGRGTVDLISANPLPADGIAHITARTADEHQNQVSDVTAVVFSGVPYVTVTPGFAALDQSYRLTVSDRNNNPLAAGTTINVRVEGTRVKAVGHTGVLLDDTAFIGGLGYEHVVRGVGITEFLFSAVQDLRIEEEGTPEVESITITVSGPNGGLEIVLLREGQVFSKTLDVMVEQEGESVRAWLNE